MVKYLEIIGGKQKIQNKRLCIILSIIMLFPCILSGCDQSTQVQEKPYIAVITKATESKFWKSVYGGVKTAATEYNVNVTFEGAENEEDYIAQNKLIEKAVARGAQAIVFSAIDSNKSVNTIKKAMDAGVYVVIIDSGINSKDINVEISTNNYSAGEMAADAVLQNKAKELKVGVVNFDINSANGYQREAGFKKKVLKDKRVKIVDIINVDSNTNSSVFGTKKMLEEHPEINVIAAFNEWTSLGVGYAIQNLRLADEVQVVGFDSNVILDDMLEKGYMDALIVQNPFAIGYLGVENAYNLIRKNKKSESVIYTDTTLITRENMFDEANQKILFPIER